MAARLRPMASWTLTGFVFRGADAYLMYAECAARGAADKTKGQQYLDAVRARAGVGSIALTLDNIIDERGRELYYEGFRRQDLIRFGLFTSDKYLWEFKGGVQAGKAVDDRFNLCIRSCPATSTLTVILSRILVINRL